MTWSVFAYRTDDAADLESCDDPVGLANDTVLHQLLDESPVIIAIRWTCRTTLS